MQTRRAGSEIAERRHLAAGGADTPRADNADDPSRQARMVKARFAPGRAGSPYLPRGVSKGQGVNLLAFSFFERLKG
jgi:hypothetical protein